MKTDAKLSEHIVENGGRDVVMRTMAHFADDQDLQPGKEDSDCMLVELWENTKPMGAQKATQNDTYHTSR